MPDAKYLFYSCLLEMGFRLLRLQPIDSLGVCTCRDGVSCSNAGKHPPFGRSIRQSLFQSTDQILLHLESGGGVGLSLWHLGTGLDCPPASLVVFDCDDQQGESWLADRGVSSVLKVRGKRGVHVYCLLATGLPPFKSNTRYLRPHNGTPSIDVKTSGIVVLPWSPNKVLEINGRVAFDDPGAVSALLGSLRSFTSNLPQVDPREVCPGMVLRVPEEAKKDRKSGNRKLSKRRPGPGSFSSPLTGLYYEERLKRARRYAEVSAPPSIQGSKPHAALLKLLCNLIHHFGLSRHDTWVVVKKQYNPRCKDTAGNPYPWRKLEVAEFIGKAVESGSYSTLTQAAHCNPDWVTPDLSKALERQKRKGQSANERKRKARLEAKWYDFWLIRRYIQELCIELTDQTNFAAVLRDLNQWLASENTAAVSGERLRQYLRTLGMQVQVGRIRNTQQAEPSVILPTTRLTPEMYPKLYTP